MKRLLHYTLGLNSDRFATHLSSHGRHLGSPRGAFRVYDLGQARVNPGRAQGGWGLPSTDSGNAGAGLSQMSAALAGVNQGGVAVADVLAQLAGALQNLKKLDGPGQLLAIAAALSKLDPSASAKISMRYGDEQFTRVTRDILTRRYSREKDGSPATFSRFGRTFSRTRRTEETGEREWGAVELDLRGSAGDGSKMGGRNLAAAFRPEQHTALERMGFVFRGGTGADPATQTARNTARMATGIESLLKIASKNVGQYIGMLTGVDPYGFQP